MLMVTWWQFSVGLFCVILVFVWGAEKIIVHLIASYYYRQMKPKKSLETMTESEIRNMFLRRSK